MTPELFDQTLRELLGRKPFRPFVVELKDGRSITISEPGVAFGGGAAGFLDEERGLVDFSWQQVRAFRPATDPAGENGMNPELFDETLRRWTRREPFQPFLVELKDGRRILVPHPAVAFGGGVACLPTEEEGLVGFAWNEVREIREATQGASA